MKLNTLLNICRESGYCSKVAESDLLDKFLCKPDLVNTCYAFLSKWPINSTPPKADPNPMVQTAAHACQFANSIKWPLVHPTGNFPFSKCEPMKLLSTAT